MSSRLKALLVFGTRPEAIKLAPVIQEIKQHAGIGARVCVTGQHREMLDSAMQLFGVTADRDLNIMKADQTPNEVAAAILQHFPEILQQEAPDWVLIQGDTTTSMAVALAAFHQGVRVGHIEAGLRTGNKLHPFPEEANRRIAGAVADAHFAPTENARRNLLNEGVPDNAVFVTGNTGIDALLLAAARPASNEVANLIDLAEGRRIVFVTAHRRENFGEPLDNICSALAELATRFADSIAVFYAVHPNPNVRKGVERLTHTKGIHLLPPVDYFTTVQIMKHAHLILTDSGGIQEEAPALGKPVVVLRQHTERPEGIQAGCAVLAGTSASSIVEHAARLLQNESEYNRMAAIRLPYGDGHASKRIVQTLLQLS